MYCVLNQTDIYLYVPSVLLFVEAAHLMLHLCVFSSNDMSFAIKMADLINYGTVTVSNSVVILFLVLIGHNMKSESLTSDMHLTYKHHIVVKIWQFGKVWPLTPRGRWTASHNFTVLFLSHDVKNTKFVAFFMLLNVSDSTFLKLSMFWMWHQHDMALWCHGGGAWHSSLILTTASNGNSWADVANHVTRLWQVGDTGNFECRITGLLWAISRSRAVAIMG